VRDDYRLVARAAFALHAHVAVDDTPKPNRVRWQTPGQPAGALPNSSKWFAEDVLTHEPALRGYLRSRFPSLRDFDDFVQESYLRILKANAAGIIKSPKAFLFTTARNLALNHLRHVRHAPNVLGKTDASDVLDESVGVSETVARAQEIQILNEAIQSLPERCRQVFTLRRIYGLSAKEVAARLGLSEKTVDAQCIIALRKCVQHFRRAAAPAVRKFAATHKAELLADLPVSQFEFPHG